MKKLIITALLINSCLLLNACFPTAERQSKSSPINIENPPEKTQGFIELKLAENLFVKANIESGKTKKLTEKSIVLGNFSRNVLKTNFFKRKQVQEKRETPNDIFPKYKNSNFQFTDNSTLIIEPGLLEYRDSKIDNIDYHNIIFGSNYFIRPDLKDVYKETSLEGINKNNSVDMLKATLGEVGITNLGEPTIISLDIKTLESEWEDYETKEGGSPRKWQKEDEAYVITFPVDVNNIDITTKGYFDVNTDIPIIGSRILGIVNKDGLVFLSCHGIYNIDGNETHEDITTISFKTALKKIKDKYRDVLITQPLVISKLSLEYVPVITQTNPNKFKLAPTWVVTANEEVTVSDDKKGKFSVSSTFNIFINAEDGQEIRSGGNY